MPDVIIADDQSFERALRRFKKKCEKAGIRSAYATIVITRNRAR
jgi:ribosomal protein S21